MQEFELYGTVRAVVSVCDSLNYITDRDELRHVFELVNNYLDPEGIFLFDMNTVHKYRDLLGDTTIAENRDEGSFIWDNSYDEEEGLNYYELAVFLPREDGLYEKSEEVHCQKAYPQEEIETLIKEAGMELLAVYDAYTLNPATEDSERLFLWRGERQEETIRTKERLVFYERLYCKSNCGRQSDSCVCSGYNRNSRNSETGS